MDTAQSQYNPSILKRGRQDSQSHGGELMMDTEAGWHREGMQAGDTVSSGNWESKKTDSPLNAVLLTPLVLDIWPPEP